MLFSKNSQLILRNRKMFETKKVFFSGNIQDNFPAYLPTINTKINFQKYNDYINFKKNNVLKKNNVYNRLLISKEMLKNCDTVIYFWPKNKSEAKFQLINLMFHLPINTQIFIVGQNSSGVKSSFLILKNWIELYKIDNAKHSILISGIIKKKKQFILESFFKIHKWKDFYITFLPGVFGYKKIDEGSKLLASTFSKKINGKILDVGCGSGFLSVCLLYFSPNVSLTLIDNDVSALKCSQITLNDNSLKANIIKSDLYSDIFEKFDLIISNPPFHEDLKLNFNIIKKIVFGAKKHLTYKGELRFVTNSCFNYSSLLKEEFKRFHVLKKTSKYKVYQSFLN